MTTLVTIFLIFGIYYVVGNAFMKSFRDSFYDQLTYTLVGLCLIGFSILVAATIVYGVYSFFEMIAISILN